MSKETVKENKVQVKTRGQFTQAVWRVIIGFGSLLAVLSISYSTIIIIMGTDGIVPIICVAPQAIFAAAILIDNFVIKRSK